MLRIPTDRDSDRLRQWLRKWAQEPGRSQVKLAEGAGLSRQWLNAFISGSIQTIDLDRIRRLAAAMDIDLRGLLEASGIVEPLSSDLRAAVEQDRGPDREHVLQLVELLGRRPVLAQIMVALQSQTDTDLAVVLRQARGMAQSVAALLAPPPEMGAELAQCERCATWLSWWREQPGDMPPRLCATCDAEINPSRPIGRRVRRSAEEAAAGLREVDPGSTTPEGTVWSDRLASEGEPPIEVHGQVMRRREK